MENSGIPLCFRCFKGIDDPDAFNLSLIMEGISYVHNLFKDKKCQLIFLAFQTKLAISKSDSHKEPFFILTNGNTRDAIKHYGYRFGSIEFIFKNQKSNGFYLESTKMRNIHAFTTLFTLVCIAILWLTILGADYSKNKNHFKNCFKIKYSKKMVLTINELFLYLTLVCSFLILLLNPQNILSSSAIFCYMIYRFR